MPNDPAAKADLTRRISQAVRSEMTDRNLSQSELADILGVARTTVVRKFMGDRDWTLSDVAKLASVWQVPITALIPDDGEAA